MKKEGSLAKRKNTFENKKVSIGFDLFFALAGFSPYSD